MKKEFGRSMVEMLGTLAVIGVISVAALVGYDIAMAKYHTNNISHDVGLAMTAIDSMPFDQIPFPENAESVDKLSLKSNYSIYYAADYDSEFYIEVRNLGQKVCDYLYEDANPYILSVDVNGVQDGICHDNNDNVVRFRFTYPIRGNVTLNDVVHCPMEDICGNSCCTNGDCIDDVCYDETGNACPEGSTGVGFNYDDYEYTDCCDADEKVVGDICCPIGSTGVGFNYDDWEYTDCCDADEKVVGDICCPIGSTGVGLNYDDWELTDCCDADEKPLYDDWEGWDICCPKDSGGAAYGECCDADEKALYDSWDGWDICCPNESTAAYEGECYTCNNGFGEDESGDGGRCCTAEENAVPGGWYGNDTYCCPKGDIYYFESEGRCCTADETLVPYSERLNMKACCEAGDIGYSSAQNRCCTSDETLFEYETWYYACCPETSTGYAKTSGRCCTSSEKIVTAGSWGGEKHCCPQDSPGYSTKTKSCCVKGTTVDTARGCICMTGVTCGNECCGDGFVCSGGQCTCPSGNSVCGDSCCRSGETCTNGKCIACADTLKNGRETAARVGYPTCNSCPDGTFYNILNATCSGGLYNFSSATGTCDSFGPNNTFTVNGTTFHFSIKRTTWWGAKDWCERQGWHLATLSEIGCTVGSSWQNCSSSVLSKMQSFVSGTRDNVWIDSSYFTNCSQHYIHAGESLRTDANRNSNHWVLCAE